MNEGFGSRGSEYIKGMRMTQKRGTDLARGKGRCPEEERRVNEPSNRMSTSICQVEDPVQLSRVSVPAKGIRKRGKLLRKKGEEHKKKERGEIGTSLSDNHSASTFRGWLLLWLLI